MAQDGAAAGVAVLDVENRVVSRLLHHLDEVEVEGGVVLAGQHEEADDVLADLLDDLAQGNEGARSLGLLHQLAAALQVNKLSSEEPTYELQSLMRNSYAVYCLT